MARPRRGDRFRGTCHDARGALVKADVIAESVTRMTNWDGPRYCVEVVRPGGGRMEFCVDEHGGGRHWLGRPRAGDGYFDRVERS